MPTGRRGRRALKTTRLAEGSAPRWVRGELAVETRGPACHDVTAAVNAFLRDIGAGTGALCAVCQHTTASLVVQENADPDVQRDLIDALARVAPADAPYRHNTEGSDDMPGHVKAAVTGHAAPLLVSDGRLLLGTWQALYLVEHRTAPHTRRVWLHYTGD